MSEEIAVAAADLALIERLTREANDLQADRDHWTREAQRLARALYVAERAVLRHAADAAQLRIVLAELRGLGVPGHVTARIDAALAVAPFGTCTRCGRPLNNVSPGFSIVAGGASVCGDCLGTGDDEVARAR